MNFSMALQSKGFIYKFLLFGDRVPLTEWWGVQTAHIASFEAVCLFCKKNLRMGKPTHAVECTN